MTGPCRATGRHLRDGRPGLLVRAVVAVQTRPGLTRPIGSGMLNVVHLNHRLAALVCVVALLQGGWAECAGWQPTPQARRACCEENPNCPGHKNDQDNTAPVSQAAADSCCAASESDESNPSGKPFAATITVAVLQPALSVVAPQSSLVHWHAVDLAGLRASPVPKHLLLSVFLV